MSAVGQKHKSKITIIKILVKEFFNVAGIGYGDFQIVSQTGNKILKNFLYLKNKIFNNY